MAQATWIARLLAALLSLACMLLSLVLVSKNGFLGFAIGGWTGLKGYEQAIVNARHMANVSMTQLAAVQLVGGTLAGFSFATFLAWMIFLEIATALHY